MNRQFHRYSDPLAFVVAAILLGLMICLLVVFLLTGKPAFHPTYTAFPSSASERMLMEADPDNGIYICSPYSRFNIYSVTFLDTLQDAPEDAWDVSLLKNGKVLAWVVPNQDVYRLEGEEFLVWGNADEEYHDLYIAAEGGVVAPENCSYLFSEYASLRSVSFGDCFDTALVTDMRDMFSFNFCLETLDLTGFDTASVSDMRYMFFTCPSLAQLDLSSFDMASVIHTEQMFTDCPAGADWQHLLH